MKKKFVCQLMVTAIIGFMASRPLFAQEESLTLNPSTGNYLLRYMNDDDVMVEMTVIPPTKVKPVLSSQFLGQTNGNTRYQYQVAVDSSSPQGLEDFWIDVSQATISKVIAQLSDGPLGTPTGTAPGWRGEVSSSPLQGFQRVAWSLRITGEDETEGLRAGAKASGFVLDSTDLPGILVAELHGSAPSIGFPGGSPGESPVGLELSEKVELAFVPRFAAAPLIPVRLPWNAAETIGALRFHVETWSRDELQQLEPTFGSQVSGWLFTISSAADRGDQQAALDGINGLLGLVRTTQNKYKITDPTKIPAEGVARATPQWPITNLAARVLTYDLGYILNRLKKKPLVPQPEQF